MKKSVLSLCLALLIVIQSSAQQKFPVTSVVDAPAIADRPVALDAQGKLLPWPMPDNIGYSYSSHVLSQWTVLWDQYNRQRLHYFHCCFDIDKTTYELIPDQKWANSTGYLRAMMQGFIERLYPYTGDPRMITFLEDFFDYELEHGTTPADYAWSGVPYASADPGVADYRGWSNHGHDYIEPHVVGEDGYAYLRLYEMTGNTKYLAAAIRCANALVKNYKPGDEAHSPWPVRCYAKDGTTRGEKPMGPYSANVIEPIMLFDELIRLKQGNVADYNRTRANAWRWFQTYPLVNNVWVGYFEDVSPSMGNMNQVIPLEFARYVLLHPEKDPQWREHSRELIDWVKTTPKWPKYIVHGATVTTEQGNGTEFCCNQPNQCCDSHTSRLAAVEALYFAKTGDESYREMAFRSYNWVTYFQGLPGKTHAPWGENQWWFTDEFADGPRRLMDAFWAVPEWAPADESHLLGSSSVVTKISYGKGSVTYSTFDPESTDVLRLDFAPESVMANGRPLARARTLPSSGSGFTFDESTRALRIRHDARDIDIQGRGGKEHPDFITFDDPHLAAGTALEGSYPSGVLQWTPGEWKIGIPDGKFGTFNLLPASASSELHFSFVSPRIFAGIDINNAGSTPSSVTLRAQGLPDVAITLDPGQLRRIRTGWTTPTSQVTVSMQGRELKFDNLAFTHP